MCGELNVGLYRSNITPTLYEIHIELHVTSSCEVRLEKVTVTPAAIQFRALYETQLFITFSREPTKGPYSKSVGSSPHTCTLFL